MTFWKLIGEIVKLNLNNLDLQLLHVCQIPLTTKFF